MRLLSLFALSLFLPLQAFAQTNAPTDLPEPLRPLADRGAQIRYIGTESGMDGWVAIYQGQEQYYYITPDKKAFVTGLMFANDGRPVTIEQVRALQAKSGDVLDLLAEPAPGAEAATKAQQNPLNSVADNITAKTPAERLFKDVENSNWFVIGNPAAPEIYSFIDPQCPHCHEFLKDLKADYIDKGLIEVRLIPVGFLAGSLEQAAFLMASPDPAALFQRHLDGDKAALPAKSDISTQAVQKNMALMQAWKFNVTPLTVYRGRDGKVKILRGNAKDIQALIADLPTVSTTPAAGMAR